MQNSLGGEEHDTCKKKRKPMWLQGRKWQEQWYQLVVVKKAGGGPACFVDQTKDGDLFLRAMENYFK